MCSPMNCIPAILCVLWLAYCSVCKSINIMYAPELWVQPFRERTAFENHGFCWLFLLTSETLRSGSFPYSAPWKFKKWCFVVNYIWLCVGGCTFLCCRETWRMISRPCTMTSAVNKLCVKFSEMKVKMVKRKGSGKMRKSQKNCQVIIRRKKTRIN